MDKPTLTAELLADLPNRRAVDDMAKRHNTTPTDIMLTIGNTPAMRKYFRAQEGKAAALEKRIRTKYTPAEVERRRNTAKWTADKVQKLAELCNTGKTAREIGDIMGINAEAVANGIKNYLRAEDKI